MPSVLETMWAHCDKKEFAEVKELIDANPEVDFVNALHPRNGRTLPVHMLHLTMNPKKKTDDALLFSLLCDPRMNWNFIVKKAGPVNTLMDWFSYRSDLTALESMKDVRGFIVNDNTFVYEAARSCLKFNEDYLQTSAKKAQELSELDPIIDCIENLKKALVVLRDIVILHALKEDDDLLLDRLEQAGGDPLDSLSEFGNCDTLSALLGVNQANPKLEVWRLAAIARERATRTESRLETQMNRYRFLKAQEQQIIDEHNAKELEIIREATEGREGRISTVLSLMSV